MQCAMIILPGVCFVYPLCIFLSHSSHSVNQSVAAVEASATQARLEPNSEVAKRNGVFYRQQKGVTRNDFNVRKVNDILKECRIDSEICNAACLPCLYRDTQNTTHMPLRFCGQNWATTCITTTCIFTCSCIMHTFNELNFCSVYFKLLRWGTCYLSTNNQ